MYADVRANVRVSVCPLCPCLSVCLVRTVYAYSVPSHCHFTDSSDWAERGKRNELEEETKRTGSNE